MKNHVGLAEGPTAEEKKGGHQAGAEDVEGLVGAMLERFASAAARVLGRPVAPTADAILALDSDTLRQIDVLMDRESETYFCISARPADDCPTQRMFLPNPSLCRPTPASVSPEPPTARQHMSVAPTAPKKR